MPQFRITAPDGTAYDVTGPEGSTAEQALAQVQAQHQPKTSAQADQPSSVGQQLGNFAAGAIRGAGSIGATLLYPIDKATDLIKGDRQQTLSGLVAGQKPPLSRNDERRQLMDDALQSLGAQPDSLAYKGGKLGGEIAGTAGAGGLLGRGLLAVAPRLATFAPNALAALESGGMQAGSATGATNALLRIGGGAVNGAASAGLVNPSDAATGGVVGGILPGAVGVAGRAGAAVGNALADIGESASRRLMQSAIKPTIAQLKSGDAAIAVQTLLDHGINPTHGGVNKLRDLIDTKNSEISSAIGSSNATIDKQNVLAGLAPVRTKFGNQVSPTADLNTIQGVEDDFLAHPSYPGSTLPVQAAQDLKQGTYQVLKGKYGQVGSPDTEAQKGLARGLKEQIASAVPEVGPLNAEESRLLTTLSVAERRALMEMNKNPMGLAALAHSPLSWAAFMADKSALFKSLAARAVNSASAAPNALAALANSPAQQLAYRSAPVVAADQ